MTNLLAAFVRRTLKSVDRAWDRFDSTPEEYYGERKTVTLMNNLVGPALMVYVAALEAYAQSLEAQLGLETAIVHKPMLTDEELAVMTAKREEEQRAKMAKKSGFYQDIVHTID